MFKFLFFLFRSKTIKSENGYLIVRQPFVRDQYEHRNVAVRILGRELRWDEVVHHIDGVRTNNSPENLCVMIDHAHEHYHRWYRWKKQNGQTPDRIDQLYKLRGLNGILLEEVLDQKFKQRNG